MKVFMIILLGFLSYSPAKFVNNNSIKSLSGKCTGSRACSACKNCKYCKHCAYNGGSCGVCSR